MDKARQRRGSNRKKLWIGFVKVFQPGGEGVLGRADNAYTNAIAGANSRASFRGSVKNALSELGLELVRLENAETLRSRLSKHTIDKELSRLAKEVAKTDRVGFGTFHTFDPTKL